MPILIYRSAAIVNNCNDKVLYYYNGNNVTMVTMLQYYNANNVTMVTLLKL